MIACLEAYRGDRKSLWSANCPLERFYSSLTFSLSLSACYQPLKMHDNADLIHAHTHMPICVNVYAIPVSFDLAVLTVYVQERLY